MIEESDGAFYKRKNEEAIDRHIAALTERNAALERIAKYVGVCMSCIHGSYDSNGCTDCLGTGWEQGVDPIKRNAALEKELAEANARHDYAPDDPHMTRVSSILAYFQDVLAKFGDSCVYVRRGGVSWGAVALNRRDDDKTLGVFDMQAQHDRDMLQRAEQVRRLIASNHEMQSALTTITAESDKAYNYAVDFLTCFVDKYCNPVPNFEPLPDLLGVLTQIDNATTVIRDLTAERDKAVKDEREACATVVENYKWASPALGIIQHGIAKAIRARATLDGIREAGKDNG